MNDTVVVVGAGPVGLMLAYELGLAGVETVLVDRLAQQDRRSPGTAINTAVVEMLTQRGLMESLQPYGFEWPMAHFSHLFLDPAKLSGRHPYTFIVPQTRLERHLEEHVRRLGVDVRRGHELVGLDQHESGVVVQVDSGSGARSIRCRYVVGCDGAGSTVRNLAEIDFVGGESPFHGIVADLRAEQGDDLFALLGMQEYPAGIVTVSPLSPTELRLTIGEFGVAPPDRNAPPTPDELRATISRLTAKDLKIAEPHWLSRWYNVTRHAATYRNRRVFLAGDAGHVHFPLGGQALSTGIEDAVNLGWKLAADIHGWAPPGLLDTYQSERHPVGVRACMTTKAQIALMHPLEEVAPLRQIFKELIQFKDVNEYLVTMVGGLSVRYSMEYPEQGDEIPQHPLLGYRIPNVSLTISTGPAGVAQLFHSGRGVLLDFSRDGARGRGVPGWADRVDTVTAEPTAEIGATVVLARPDGRVAWADQATADNTGLHAALAAWFGVPNTTADNAKTARLGQL
jgi:2-polyprenyl-6-methoxyphenol hydroxylase-like FAD-dependent oxidoreductase